MADENTPNPSPAPTPAPTPDEAGNNTAANPPGTGTQPAQPEVTEKTFTQAEVNAMIAKRLPSAVKAELKKMSGDETQPNVDDLQRQLSERDTKLRSYEARETVDAFLNDGRNKLNIRPENLRGIQELVIPRLEFGDDGKPTNIKEAIESAKVIAPALFVSGTSNINQFSGNGQQARPGNMNDFIRQAAGHGS